MNKFKELNEDFEHEKTVLQLKFISEIEHLMEEMNVSKKDLADQIGLSTEYLTQLFKGTKSLDFEIIAKIQSALECGFTIKAHTVLPKFEPTIIKYEKREFYLKYPLHCHVSKEKYGYQIKSELLDIIGTGKTEQEAERNFCHDFDFIYNSYNELKDSDLSERSLKVKNALNALVKRIV